MKLASKLQKEWRTLDGESDWGMISRVIKILFWKEVNRVSKCEHARDKMLMVKYCAMA